jgi:hypothetical protein
MFELGLKVVDTDHRMLDTDWTMVETEAGLIQTRQCLIQTGPRLKQKHGWYRPQNAWFRPDNGWNRFYFRAGYWLIQSRAYLIKAKGWQPYLSLKMAEKDWFQPDTTLLIFGPTFEILFQADGLMWEVSESYFF